MSVPLDPTVVEADAQELAALQEVQRLAQAEPAAPEPEPTAPAPAAIDHPTSGQTPAAAPPVDLTALPEFRKYQAEADRRLEQERVRRLDLERRLSEAQTRQEQAQIADLMQRAADEVDPLQQRQHIDQLTALRAQQYTRQMQEWEAYKVTQITAAGLDPADQRFRRQYAPGETGLHQFRADIVEAQNERLKAELTQARRAADPTTVAQLVKQELAKALQASGQNFVDVGAPQAQTDDAEAFARDVQLAQTGRLTADAFVKKWGTR